MGVNKMVFSADSASFASVGVVTMFVTILTETFDEVAGLALHPARPHLFLNNRGDLTPLSAGGSPGPAA